jgi:cytochrome c oxidase cbb3-type subunit 3
MNMLFLPFLLWLQGANVAQISSSVTTNQITLLYLIAGFMILVALLVFVVAVMLLRVVRALTESAEREKAESLGIRYQPEPSWWQRLWQQANQSVPVEKEAAITLDHNYDGIKELDNHLPPWWRWLFIGSIVWGAVYLLAYHVFDYLPLSGTEYETQVALAEEQSRKAKAAKQGPVIDETNVEYTDNEALLADGKSIFLNTCASCHRRDGGGDIGPNLTDDYWKHGGSIRSIFKVVKEGIPGTNMVAWGSAMSPEAIRNVSSYVLTLRGTQPQNPKKPEGDLYKPEVDVKGDTTQAKASL